MLMPSLCSSCSFSLSFAVPNGNILSLSPSPLSVLLSPRRESSRLLALLPTLSILASQKSSTKCRLASSTFAQPPLLAHHPALLVRILTLPPLRTLQLPNRFRLPKMIIHLFSTATFQPQPTSASASPHSQSRPGFAPALASCSVSASAAQASL